RGAAAVRAHDRGRGGGPDADAAAEGGPARDGRVHDPRRHRAGDRADRLRPLGRAPPVSARRRRGGGRVARWRLPWRGRQPRRSALSGAAELAASYSPAREPAIVALQGAGEGTRESPLYPHLHDLLPPAGIAVVTFDRRGEGESTGDSSRGRFDVQVDDALAVL